MIRLNVDLCYDAHSVAMLQITARRYYCIIVITFGHQLKCRIIYETCISYFGYVMQSATCVRDIDSSVREK